MKMPSKGIFLPLFLLILGASIAVGAYVTAKGGSIFELRKKAAPAAPSSRLYFQGPSQVKIGEQFSVNLYLDTSNDPKYTISGFDARITIANDLTVKDSVQGMPAYLPPHVLTLTKVTPSPSFDSYPGLGDTGFQPSSPDRPVTQTVTQGSSGQAAVGVNINPSVTASPTSEVCPPFPGCEVINNPQIRMPWAQCWVEAMKKCPVPTPTPTSQTRLAIGNLTTISGVKNYAVDDKGRFKGFTENGVVATLTFVAERPGRATLQFVYTSPTATDDSNVTGFLADQPASLQKPQERLLVAPEPFIVEVVSGVTITPKPSVVPTCIPVPDCVDGVEDATGRKIGICQLTPPPPSQTYCPRPTVTPKPTVVPPTPTPTVSPTPTPTPTPEPRVLINFRLQLEGRKNHTTVVDIYGMTTTNAQPSKELLQALGAGGSTVVSGGRVDKLGTAVTDPSGIGVLSLDRGYAGGSYMILLAQTPSHLRKAAQNYQGIRLDVGQNPVCRAEICTQEVKYVDFGMLTAGDVYTDEKGNKDNLINTFDAGAVFAAWSGANIVANQRDQTSFGGILPKEIGPAADLNGDGVVNNRDLAMLLGNFNKRGESSVDVKPPPDIRPLPVSTITPQ